MSYLIPRLFIVELISHPNSLIAIDLWWLNFISLLWKKRLYLPNFQTEFFSFLNDRLSSRFPTAPTNLAKINVLHLVYYPQWTTTREMAPTYLAHHQTSNVLGYDCFKLVKSPQAQIKILDSAISFILLSLVNHWSYFLRSPMMILAHLLCCQPKNYWDFVMHLLVNHLFHLLSDFTWLKSLIFHWSTSRQLSLFHWNSSSKRVH